MLLGGVDVSVTPAQHHANTREIFGLAYVVVEVDALTFYLLGADGELGDELRRVAPLGGSLKRYLEGAVGGACSSNALHAMTHPVDVESDGLVAHTRDGVRDS